MRKSRAVLDRSKDAEKHPDEFGVRVLNKIRKPSTAEEITELLNRELGLRDQVFDAKEVNLASKRRRQSCSPLLAGNASSPVSFFLVFGLLKQRRLPSSIHRILEIA
jgi:hypothetical protein